MKQLLILLFMLLSVVVCAPTVTAYAETSIDSEFEEDMKNFSPVRIEVAMTLAKKYIAYERFDLAEIIYRKVYDTKPINFTFYTVFASFLERLGRIPEAIEVLETCRDSKGIFAYDSEVMLGKLYFKTQNYRKAARVFEKASSINQLYPEPIFYWAISATFLGLEGEPARALELLAKRFPNSKYVPLGKAIHNYFIGDFDKANEFLSSIDESEGVPVFYFIFKSALLIQSAKYEEAKTALSKAQEIDPLFEGIFTNLAVIALITEKKPAKIKEALDFASRFEGFQELALARAFYFYRIGDTEEAKRVLTNCLKKKSSLYYANYLMSVILFQEIEKILKSKKSDEENKKEAAPLISKAVEHLDYCTSTGKDFFAAFFMLGRISFIKGDYLKALKNFEKASKLSPKEVTVQIYIGHSYLKLKKINEAKRMFEAVIQIDDKNIHALNALGFISAITGNTKQAIDYFKSSIAIEGKNPYAKSHLQYLKNLEKERRKAK